MTETPDFTWMFVKMMAGLVLVLGLAIVLVRYLLPKTGLGKSGISSWARVIGRFSLEPRKNLYVVKILERYFVLSSSEHSVQTISELTKTEGEKIEVS